MFQRLLMWYLVIYNFNRKKSYIIIIIDNHYLGLSIRNCVKYYTNINFYLATIL